MVLRGLVVSDPPHQRIDQQAAAELLGLTVAELRMKADFPAPEVWLAFQEMDQANSAANALQQTGLNTGVVDGFDLRSLPGPDPVTSFAFAETGFVARFPGEERELPYDRPTLAVFCRPSTDVLRTLTSRSPHSPASRPSALDPVDDDAGELDETDWTRKAEALELTTNLDLYTAVDGEVVRTSIDKDVVDFSGLGDLLQPSNNANMDVCVSECERFFDSITLDVRLKDMQPRQRAIVGSATEWDQERKLFSFGTLSLRQLLGSIAPELRDLTQFELGSRLAYLLSQA